MSNTVAHHFFRVPFPTRTSVALGLSFGVGEVGSRGKFHIYYWSLAWSHVCKQSDDDE
jgi:hypothetical protein